MDEYIEALKELKEAVKLLHENRVAQEKLLTSLESFHGTVEAIKNYKPKRQFNSPNSF